MSLAPSAPHPSRYFGGSLLAQRRTDAMTVSYVRYEPGRCRSHAHEHPFLALVTAGAYCERWASGHLALGATGVAAHPAGITHADEILAPGTRVCVVEAGSSLAAHLIERDAGVPRGDRSAPRDLGPTAAGRVAELLALVRAGGLAEPVVTESLAVDAFAEAYAPLRERGPSWVRRVTELLYDGVDRPLTLRDLARVIGVHPVYLSRAYRAATGTGIAEARQRARVRRAIAALAAGEPAVEVALNAGFADQSHMTRMVRRLSGLTPSRWRELGRS